MSALSGAGKYAQLLVRCEGLAPVARVVTDAVHSHAAAAKAAERVLRTGRRASHVFKMEIPTYHEVLIVMAFDNAISKEAARTKGIESDAGDPDVPLVPHPEAGNLSARARIASSTGAMLAVHARRQKPARA